MGAIVVLKQGNDNQIEPLPTIRKVQAIATGIEIYRWDKYEVDKAIEISADIVSSVPVIGLSCRPDADAVFTLKNYLEALGIWN